MDLYVSRPGNRPGESQRRSRSRRDTWSASESLVYLWVSIQTEDLQRETTWRRPNQMSEPLSWFYVMWGGSCSNSSSRCSRLPSTEAPSSLHFQTFEITLSVTCREEGVAQGRKYHSLIQKREWDYKLSPDIHQPLMLESHSCLKASKTFYCQNWTHFQAGWAKKRKNCLF